MGRLLQLLTAVAVAVIAALVYSFRDMTVQTAGSIALLRQDEEEALLAMKLDSKNEESQSPQLQLLSAERQQEEFDKLPPVVQTYLEKAVPHLDKTNVASTVATTRVKSLAIKQKGTFSLKENHWVPFTATQFFSAALYNLGFVWDAVVFMAEPIPTFVSNDIHLDLPVFVQDTYVRGKGLLEARFLGVLPVAHVYDNADINAGELMRWLAESLLFPTVLLPTHDNILQWKPAADMDPHKARLTIVDPQSTKGGKQQTKVSLTVHFNETTGLPSMFVGMRAKADTGPNAEPGAFSYTRWQGNVGTYIDVNGMKVPSNFQAGWWNSKKKSLDLYFKAENYDFDYEYY